ncbi:MAG: nitroreductase family protein [bacterium]
MSINFGRAQGLVEIRIDEQRCTVCGLCIRVCKGGPLSQENKQIKIDQTQGIGCVACGQCVAICPQNCITVNGRDLLPEDVIPIPAKNSRTNYAQLQALLLSRRSIREYKDKPVEPEVVQQIIDAVTTAPMGVPPSEVSMLVLNSKEKVQAFTADIVQSMKKTKWMFSPAMLYLWRPIVGKEGYQIFKTFVMPLMELIIQKHDEGADWLLYNAPLAMYFYTSPASDQTDAMIAATYATIAAESLGLGSCMIGTIAPILKQNKQLQQKYGIPRKSRHAILVIFGYPALTYKQAIKRRLAEVKYY